MAKPPGVQGLVHTTQYTKLSSYALQLLRFSLHIYVTPLGINLQHKSWINSAAFGGCRSTTILKDATRLN